MTTHFEVTKTPAGTYAIEITNSSIQSKVFVHSSELAELELKIKQAKGQ